MIESIIGQIAIAILLIIVGYFLKRGLSATEDNLRVEITALNNEQKRMNGSVKEVMEKHVRCREELPKRFIDIDAFNTHKKDEGAITQKIFDKLEYVAIDVGIIKETTQRVK